MNFPPKKWTYFSVGEESIVLKAMAEQQMDFRAERSPERGTSAAIRRVPIGIIGGNENSFRPIALAVGPYHHGNENLRRTEACKAGAD